MEKAHKLESEAMVDDEGFTVVKSRNKRKKSNSDGKGKDGKGRKRTKKDKGAELKNFYRFQVREQKKDGLMSLREKFAKDQEKIALLKAARKFNPFN